MSKIGIVKKEFERAYDKGLINVNVRRYSSHCYIEINSTEAISIDNDGVSVYYPFSKDIFEFIFNTEWFEKLREECNANSVISYERDVKKIIKNSIYLNTVEWTFSESVDGLMDAARKVLYNLYYVAFLKKQISFFKQIGLEVKKEDTDKGFNKIINFVGNTVYVNFKLSKTYEALIDVLEAIHYNYDILRKYPDKLDKLRKVAFYPEEFKNKKEEGC